MKIEDVGGMEMVGEVKRWWLLGHYGGEINLGWWVII